MKPYDNRVIIKPYDNRVLEHLSVVLAWIKSDDQITRSPKVLES